MPLIGDAAYNALVDRLIAALEVHGAKFARLSNEDDIGGAALYGDDGSLIYDVLVLPDTQPVADGRFLFRHVNRDPMHKPQFVLQTDDLDAVVDAVTTRVEAGR